MRLMTFDGCCRRWPAKKIWSTFVKLESLRLGSLDRLLLGAVLGGFGRLQYSVGYSAFTSRFGRSISRATHLNETKKGPGTIRRLQSDQAQKLGAASQTT